MFEHVNCFLFDMDGLLVDSEPLWKIAEKEVFGKLGLSLDDELLRQVMGFRLNEVIAHWFRYQPWENPDFAKTEREIIDCMKSLIQHRATAMPGVYAVLEELQRRNAKIALASSSSMELIETVVEKLELGPYLQRCFSAQNETYGKPHPAIFINAAEAMQAKPHECLVFEDSKNGMIAALAARMHCIVVPEEVHFEKAWWSLADARLSNLEEFLKLI
ncbi:MAG: hexitol phosphatase HxpB [Bacteroidetes bacterium]|nr:hexitol phosphatase HxpB [Bacteroidota bacterium]